MQFSKKFVYKPLVSAIFTLILLFIFLLPYELLSQKNTEKLIVRKPDGVYNSIELGIDLNKGNEEYFKLAGGYRLDVLFHRHWLIFASNIEYKEGKNRLLANKGFLHFRAIHDLSDLADPEVFLQAEYNEFILLKKRFLGGTGFRFELADWISDDSASKLLLQCGIGAMYEVEDYTDETTRHTNLFRNTNYLSFMVNIGKTTEFTTAAYFQPALRDFNNFRVLNETRFAFKIAGNFSFFVSLLYRFDSQPVKNVKQYDLSLQNGFKIDF